MAIRYDGRRWYRLETGTDKELRAVSGTGPAAVYAGGQEGIALRFNGAMWQPVSTTSPAFLVALSPGPSGGLVAVGTIQTFLDLVPP